MMFLIRACFWLAIVSVFVPKDFAGADIDLPFNVQSNAIDITSSVDGWCADNSELCRAGEEAARLSGFLADMAVDRLETVVEEHQDATR